MTKPDRCSCTVQLGIHYTGVCKEIKGLRIRFPKGMVVSARELMPKQWIKGCSISCALEKLAEMPKYFNHKTGKFVSDKKLAEVLKKKYNIDTVTRTVANYSRCVEEEMANGTDGTEKETYGWMEEAIMHASP